MIKATVSQIKAGLSDYINRVADDQERIVIVSQGQPRAVMISLADLERLKALETCAISAKDAQRKVSKLLLDQVGNLLYGEKPELAANDAGRSLWRVPVWIGLPTTGPVGQVGVLNVDAQTGDILYTPEILMEIKTRGNELARRATPTTT